MFWKGKPLSSWKNGSWAHGTGSHVFWTGKPLSSWKNGSWAHGTGSHVFWKGKPLASLKIGSGAQGGVKPLRKRGRKVQSPISATWVILESKKKTRFDVGKNSFNGRHVFNKSLNEDPRLLVIMQGMPMRRVPFTLEEAEARSRTPLNLSAEDPKTTGTQEEARSRTPLNLSAEDPKTTGTQEEARSRTPSSMEGRDVF